LNIYNNYLFLFNIISILKILFLKKYLFSHLENNNNLYGEIPSINYRKEEKCPTECDFSGTQLCYSYVNQNSLCNYPETYYDCRNCMDHSSIENDICICNDGYQGIGYVECLKEGKYISFNY